MKHLAMYVAVENLLRTLPWRGLSIIAVIILGWFLRERYRWDWPDKYSKTRAYRGYNGDPTYLYKVYGSYGQS
jgi:hypothetical protein